MKDRVKSFYQKVEKYGGFQPLAAKTIHQIFERVTEPAAIGFQPVKPGLLARSINADITHVVKLRPLKGASCDICFGASLSYVPYPYLPKLRWHRTLKSVNLDIFEAPQVEWWNTAKPNERDSNPYLAHTLLGQKCFEEELARSWQNSRGQAQSWFESARTLPGILQKCDVDLNRRNDGPRHLPGARLVKAFTLAKLGMRSDALVELLQFFEEYQAGAEARTNLQLALEQLLNQAATSR